MIDINEHRDTLVISYDKVYVIRAIMEENGEEYFILQKSNGEYLHYSIAMSVYPLKGVLNDEDYDSLRRYFQINLNKISKEIK